MSEAKAKAKDLSSKVKTKAKDIKNFQGQIATGLRLICESAAQIRKPVAM